MTEATASHEAVPADELRFRRRRMMSGLAWAAITVSIFAGWFVVTRVGVTRTLRFWDITALRFAIGAVLMAPVLVRGASRYSRRDWIDGLLFSLLWGVPFVLLVSYGLGFTSAAAASSTVPTLMPVIAGTLAWVFLGERPAGQRLLGFAAIVCGMLTMAWLSSGLGHGSLLGFACLIGASTLWSIYTLVFRRSRLNGIEAAAFICVWSAVLYLPPYVFLGASHLGEASAGELALQVVYQGILVSTVAVITFNRAVAQLGAPVSSAIMALVPVVATLLAIVVLGEVPSLPEGAAIVTVALGVVLASGLFARSGNRPHP
ncbi:DMT family transporter [uncultured Alsobacter sp.]|uniref:DMT family transporter n=1 Tax=uncultured Alsobacter sp. TaxID=1748258 RepID=UPI0025D808DB|nr:DMT family transporter [uncultured Alsobacter sp.]